MTDITRAVARAIITSQPNESAREAARQGLLDFIAVTLPVIRGNAPAPALTQIKALWPGQDARSRALKLGYCAHALDFDDFHRDFRGHPGAVILSALLALAPDIPGLLPDTFLDAWVIGVEMAGRLGLAAGNSHYLNGFHNTSTLGTLAACAAIARLAGASEADTASMLSASTSMATGLRVQFGTEIKPLHAGLAAQAAVTASQLTLSGIQASGQDALRYFLAAYSPQTAQPARLIEGWGAPWRIITPGLECKPWPLCSGTHTAIRAALNIRARWQASASLTDRLAAIQRIDVTFPPGGDVATFVHHPDTGTQARFSLEYAIADSLLNGDPPLSHYGPDVVLPMVRQLADKVVRTPDFSVPPDHENPAGRFHQVTVFTEDGEQISERVTRDTLVAQGVDLTNKLRQCLPEFSEADEARWHRLARLEDGTALTQLLAQLVI